MLLHTKRCGIISALIYCVFLLLLTFPLTQINFKAWPFCFVTVLLSAFVVVSMHLKSLCGLLLDYQNST
jgi:hypothetical protein